MKTDTLDYLNNNWHLANNNISNKAEADLVFLFGDSNKLKIEACLYDIKKLYPAAHIVGASSSGNIHGPEISDSPIVATAVKFDKGHIAVSKIDFTADDNIEELSKKLIEQLPSDNLKHIFILSDGLNINGSELVRGINNADFPFSVSGGMAGDGDRFQETWIVADEPAQQNRIVAVGFYGNNFLISTGYHAGWASFGADRLVTRSSGNILYELDNRPALDLYREYLGVFAKELPYSGMRFPLCIKEAPESNGIIRTLLSIDEKTKSITFAGDIPEGYSARLMKPDINLLIDGAEKAANEINIPNKDSALGVVVSCVGRRIVMKQMVEDELEIIEEVLGDNVQLSGFYSYGEIAPVRNDNTICQLHNQTMTLTVIYEK